MRTYFIYRKCKDGSYLNVGAIKWNGNYSVLPIKQKYWKLMFLSDR